ncbi:MAG: uncharacterized protein KVP18_004127 [Porospora cf. gigantea A]|uniref:uncharacterized protein n=1 Tax=Porospora cf. gigantea A TaxID=2853593 RepID=UPI00355A6B37|nr:MAG: hypothetical protein KVP18_004127 [Porospora cf. gigantea A]
MLTTPRDEETTLNRMETTPNRLASMIARGWGLSGETCSKCGVVPLILNSADPLAQSACVACDEIESGSSLDVQTFKQQNSFPELHRQRAASRLASSMCWRATNSALLAPSPFSPYDIPETRRGILGEATYQSCYSALARRLESQAMSLSGDGNE